MRSAPRRARSGPARSSTPGAAAGPGSRVPLAVVRRPRRGNRVRGGARVRHAALMALVTFYALVPIYFITVQSLKTPQEDVFGNPLWVSDPSFENYSELFEGERARVRGYVIVPRVNFALWVGNSALVLAGTLPRTLFTAAPAAWALGRLLPPGWRWLRRG